MRFSFWPTRRRYRVLLLIAAILLAPYIASRIASPWRCLTVYPTTDVTHEATINENSPLRIACFNIAHGRGMAVSNWDGGTRGERIARLDEIAEFLRRIDADVVVLNEVDFDSSWSHSINQARYLADKSGYAYRVEQRNLDFRVLAWKWRFGNAILSKLPIQDAKVLDLPSYSFVESLLAGKKRAVACDVLYGQRKLRIIGAHLSHRSEATRVSSTKLIVDTSIGSQIPTILCGDLNSTPPDLPGSMTNSDGENAVQILTDTGQFIRPPAAQPNNRDAMTFHSEDPKMAIDWILVPKNWRIKDFTVHPTRLSDHRAVSAVLFGPPRRSATNDATK